MDLIFDFKADSSSFLVRGERGTGYSGGPCERVLDAVSHAVDEGVDGDKADLEEDLIRSSVP